MTQYRIKAYFSDANNPLYLGVCARYFAWQRDKTLAMSFDINVANTIRKALQVNSSDHEDIYEIEEIKMKRISKVSIEFYTDNAAFDDFVYEFRSVIERLCRRVDELGPTGESIKLRDSNGNTIGHASFEFTED